MDIYTHTLSAQIALIKKHALHCYNEFHRMHRTYSVYSRTVCEVHGICNIT